MIELKMNVWCWGEVLGVDSEICNNIAKMFEVGAESISKDSFLDYFKKYFKVKGLQNVFSK